MTTVPVNDLGVKMPYVAEAGGTPPASGADFMNKFKSAVETQASALNILPGQPDKAGAAISQPVKTTNDVDRSAKVSSDRNPVKHSVSKDAAEAKKGDVSANDSEETADTVKPEVIEAVNTAVEQIVDQVAVELDVSPEEIAAAMDEIGLTGADLLDPSNMTELVAALSGNQDTVTLLTDENLYQTLGNLKDYVADVNTDLMNKLDLSQEALNEALAQAEELSEPVQTPEPELISGQAAKDNPLEGMKDYKVSTQSGGESVTMDVKVDDVTGAQIVTNVSRESDAQSDSREPSQGRSGRNPSGDRETGDAMFTQTQQLNTEINNADFAVTAEEAASFRTEASDIANQIMDSMRANLREDVTELEMNLHPASLGNVRVNLQSVNGQVTAQFLAQNETVRAAIESQIVQLRESLEAQGVRIEQVEVAVASQGFDRNRDNSQGQGGEPNREQRGSGIGRTGRTRRIDLNAMEGEEIEDMDDADRIAADMMARDGNTVDYMA